MKEFNILVACEESQRVTMAFRARGEAKFNAYSCDLLEETGGHPEWHIQEDVLPLLNGNCEFDTADGAHHKIDGKWDAIIAFPPCTHLCLSGACRFPKKREDGRQKFGIEFFSQFLFADCPNISIENPSGIMSGGKYLKTWYPDLCEKYNIPRKYTQKIQPYWFGDHARKGTCLWLKGFPDLKPTDVVDPGELYGKSGQSIGASANWAVNPETGKILSWNDPLTARIRSKTFPGVAQAMADQWGDYLIQEYEKNNE